jgi:hypothetical protein
MGNLNKRVVATRRERIRDSVLFSLLGILLLVGAYYVYPTGSGYFHTRLVVGLGGMGMFFTVVSVWGLILNLTSK